MEALVLECENKEWEVPEDFEAFSNAQCAKQMREFVPNFQVTMKELENMKINPNQLKAEVVKGKDVTPLNPKVTTVIGTGVGKLPYNSYVTGALPLSHERLCKKKKCKMRRKKGNHPFQN